MKKYLITGALGFIGKNLVEYLISDGVRPGDIRILARHQDTKYCKPQTGVKVFWGDIRNFADVNSAMKYIDIVYHLASKTGHDGGSYEYFKETNVYGTSNVVKGVIANGVGKLIFFSSTAVYGLPATAGNIRNISERNTRKYSEGYGQSKYEAEDVIVTASKDKQFNYIIIRPTTVYGPYDHGGISELIKVLNKKLFIFIGPATNRSDYIYVTDLIRTARMLEKSNIFNQDFIVGSGKPITIKEAVNVICDNLGTAKPRIHLPKSLVLPASYILKILFVLAGQKPPIFPNRVRVLTSDFYFDIGKIKKAIDFEPEFDFNTGINETVSWMKKSKLI